MVIIVIIIMIITILFCFVLFSCVFFFSFFPPFFGYPPLRAEFLLKTDSEYPKDTGVTP